jgi:FkbH-like protein
LFRLAREHAGVYVLDYDALVARYGRLSWHDERKWLTMRMPIAANCLIHLSNEWLRFIQPLTGRVCKALVTDLDNTLWGGVVGEDGMGGIKLGPEYPGAAYQALQRAILDLYQRGIILAVCSKNNLPDAMEVLERHPAMLLRPEHFAVMRINWNDKAQSLHEIAAELDIGTDALAFLDDNPAERAWIRSQLPEVTVIDLPDDPMSYSQALRASPVFERLGLSTEDRERGRYYAEQRLRTELSQSVASLEDFYRSLLMEVEISLVAPETLARLAQLTQKTNQFNLTTHRYSEHQIAEIAADTNWEVYSMRVRDHFGDNGLVGMAITHYQGEVCEIDTFLLSCRVIGRTVESALLATIAEQARIKGAQQLIGWFLPTKKNIAAKEFYRSHGFNCTLDQDEGSRWEFDLTCGEIVSPPWIKRQVLLEGMASGGIGS